VTLGQSYLGDLVKKFKGSYVLALVGYNAGPHRVKRWIKRHGDPRDNDVNAVDWIELIPFNETRNYVQRVLENLQVYRLLLANKEMELRLKNDLHFSSN
jgi:soluble lytic murein transglycosylase